MKKLYLLLLAFLLLFSSQVYSSHLRGGELTWKCVKESGKSKYTFTLTVYRNCTPCNNCMLSIETVKICNTTGQLSVALNNATIPNTNFPRLQTDGTITMALKSNMDITLGCINPTVNPYSCATTEPGAFDQYVYESGPIDLTGIQAPVNAASPIMFTWYGTGRPYANNLKNNVGDNSFVIIAKMFPYFANGSTTASPVAECFDSAPDFAEVPVYNIYTSGLDFTISGNAIDKDLDNIVYSFEDPVFSVSNTDCPEFNSAVDIWENYPSYNTLNPFGLLPTQQNFNTNTGEYKFKPLMPGIFNVVMKAASYKDNQKVSEIIRDYRINFIISGGSELNRAPSIAAPFIDANGKPSFQKTVTAGTKVQIPIVVRDSTANNMALSSQSLEITVNGIAMGLNNSDTLIDCEFPPCARLNKFKNNAPYTPFNTPPVNITNSAGQSFGYGYQLPAAYGSTSNDTLWIYWGTGCNNLRFDNSAGQITPKKYDFVISVKDDSCRLPMKATRVVSITVNPPGNYLKSELTCVNFIPSTNKVELNWKNTGDSSTFMGYEIYRNNTLLRSITNYAINSYTDTSIYASSDSLYAIKLLSTCDNGNVLKFEKVIKEIAVSATLNKKDKAIITWNPLNTGKLPNTNGYMVYRSIGNTPYNWIQITDADGNNFNTTATDNVNLCGQKVYYKVTAVDLQNCVYASSIDSIINTPMQAQISKKNKCAGDLVKFKVDNLIGGVLPYTNVRWLGDEGFVSFNKDSASFTFTKPGYKKFTFTVIDAIGCRYDKLDSVLIYKVPIVNVKVDSACPGAVININIVQDSPDPDDSVFVYGDDGLFSKVGPYFDPFFRSPLWIFTSNNGIGKFPINIKVTKRFGCSITRVDTVYISEPSVFIANDSNTCCNTNTDTLRFYSKYLSKPYATIHWYDDVTKTVILSNSAVLPVSMLTTNTNMRIKLYVEDSKGCIAEDIKQFAIGTGISTAKDIRIEVYPNPTNGVLKFISSTSLQSANIRIYNTLGQLVLQQSIEQNEITVDKLPQGFYNFYIEFEGKSFRGKFVKE